MTPLSKDEKEWVKLIAREIAFQAVKEATLEHIDSCPHGKRFSIFRGLLIGVAIGCTLSGGAGGYVLAKMLL